MAECQTVWNPDETPRYSASHPDPNCLAQWSGQAVKGLIAHVFIFTDIPEDHRHRHHGRGAAGRKLHLGLRGG